jgi:hypothetical protein
MHEKPVGLWFLKANVEASEPFFLARIQKALQLSYRWQELLNDQNSLTPTIEG